MKLLLAYISISFVISNIIAQTSIIDYCAQFPCIKGGIVRGDTTEKKLALVFTGHEFGDGLVSITHTLVAKNVKASFFFTGDFYRNRVFKKHIKILKRKGHYLGAHSDKHLLYCSWENRDSTLVSKGEFTKDVLDNYRAMQTFGIEKKDALFYMPPYEWYNDTISKWTNELGLQIVNFSAGTRSNADYTTPDMKNYISSKAIYKSIIDYEESYGLNGFILLIHAGTSPKRTDKMYNRLNDLIDTLKSKGYTFVTVPNLLKL